MHEQIMMKQYSRFNPEDGTGKLPGPRSKITTHRHIHDKPDPSHSPSFCGRGHLGPRLETAVLDFEQASLVLPDKLAMIKQVYS